MIAFGGGQTGIGISHYWRCLDLHRFRYKVMSYSFAVQLASAACIIEPMSDWILPPQQHDDCTYPWEEDWSVPCC
jgi:hypothetical protein